MTDSTSTSDLADTLATTRSLETSLTELSSLSKLFGQSMTGALKGVVVQGKSLETVLNAVAAQISSRALTAALTPLSTAIGTGAASLFGSLVSALGFARGGAFDGGRVTPFASGGVVSTPTYFPLRGGTGLMGEAGAEAILPLARGADGRLGVASAGQGSTTNVVFNVDAPDPAAFRRSEAQLSSMLARAVGRGRRGL